MADNREAVNLTASVFILPDFLRLRADSLFLAFEHQRQRISAVRSHQSDRALRNEFFCVWIEQQGGEVTLNQMTHREDL